VMFWVVMKMIINWKRKCSWTSNVWLAEIVIKVELRFCNVRCYPLARSEGRASKTEVKLGFCNATRLVCPKSQDFSKLLCAKTSLCKSFCA
jgi:hypothetical protein